MCDAYMHRNTEPIELTHLNKNESDIFKREKLLHTKLEIIYDNSVDHHHHRNHRFM